MRGYRHGSRALEATSIRPGLTTWRPVQSHSRSIWQARISEPFRERKRTARIVVVFIRLGWRRRAAGDGGVLQRFLQASCGDHAGSGEPLIWMLVENS